MNKHQSVFIYFIKQVLEKNKHTTDQSVRRGARLLWKNYFRYADATDQTTMVLEPLSVIIRRLEEDLKGDTEEMRCIKAYRALHGLPF